MILKLIVAAILGGFFFASSASADVDSIARGMAKNAQNTANAPGLVNGVVQGDGAGNVSAFAFGSGVKTALGLASNGVGGLPVIGSANGVDLSGVSFSGCAFKSNNFCIPQTGIVPITSAGEGLLAAQRYSIFDDNSTDNTVALNAAAPGGSCLYFPRANSGVYKFGAGAIWDNISCLVLDMGASFAKMDGSNYDGGWSGTWGFGGAVQPASGKRVTNPVFSYVYSPTFNTDLFGHQVENVYEGVPPAGASDGGFGGGYNCVQVIGRTSTNVAGSGGCYSFKTLIYGLSSPDNGRSEITTTGGAILFEKNAVVNPAAKINTYFDWSINTPISGSIQESFMGASFFFSKNGPGNVHDADHNGSPGIVAINMPGGTGFAGSSEIADTTYMMDSLFDAEGWSGTKTVASGTSVGATQAANIAYKAGGQCLSVWCGRSAGAVARRSYFNFAANWQDYATHGLYLGNPHPNFQHSTTTLSRGASIYSDVGAGEIFSADGFRVGNFAGIWNNNVGGHWWMSGDLGTDANNKGGVIELNAHNDGSNPGQVRVFGGTGTTNAVAATFAGSHRLDVIGDATGTFAADDGVAQFAIKGATDDNKRFAFMMDTTNNIAVIQAARVFDGTAHYPIVLNKTGNGSIGLWSASFGGGVGVLAIGVANTAPTSNPTSAFLVYMDPADNALKARGPSGTVTTLALP